VSELDPDLAAACSAERNVTAAAVTAAAITRDRMLVAVLARTATKPAKLAAAHRRWPLAIAAAACISIGYAAGRVTAPEPARPVVVVAIDAGIAQPQAVPVDAAIAHDAPPPRPPQPRPRPAAIGKDNAEALLLDQARAALRRHLPADALVALEHHRRAFPTGQLREERDVLLIEVALAQDRRADANELIAGYLDRYPHGSLRGHVEELQRELDRLIGHGH
jgi:hypothetical protein